MRFSESSRTGTLTDESQGSAIGEVVASSRLMTTASGAGSGRGVGAANAFLRSSTGPSGFSLTGELQSFGGTESDSIGVFSEDDMGNPREIAFVHVSPYSKGSHDSDTHIASINVRENLIPLLENHGVDLVLSGHSHGYERSVLIDGHYGDSSTCANQECFKDGGDGNPNGTGGGYTKAGAGPLPHQGTIYAVVGNGSRTWSDAQMGDHPVMATRVGEIGSMVIDIDGAQLDAYMIDKEGVVRDQFRLSKGRVNVPAFGLGGFGALALFLLAVGIRAATWARVRRVDS